MTGNYFRKIKFILDCREFGGIHRQKSIVLEVFPHIYQNVFMRCCKFCVAITTTKCCRSLFSICNEYPKQTSEFFFQLTIISAVSNKCVRTSFPRFLQTLHQRKRTQRAARLGHFVLCPNVQRSFEATQRRQTRRQRTADVDCGNLQGAQEMFEKCRPKGNAILVHDG